MSLTPYEIAYADAIDDWDGSADTCGHWDVELRLEFLGATANCRYCGIVWETGDDALRAGVDERAFTVPDVEHARFTPLQAVLAGALVLVALLLGLYLGSRP